MAFLDTLQKIADPGDFTGFLSEQLTGKAGKEAATEAGRLQSEAALETSRIEAQAFLEAANIQGSSAIEAARIASEGAFGAAAISADAQRFAAQLQTEAAGRALAEQRAQFQATEQRLQPFVDLGLGSIGDVEQGSTVSGLDARLRQIFDSQQFGGLREERQRAATAQQAAAGGFRSGRAIEEAADISTTLGSQIESQLFGRQFGNVQLGEQAAAQVGAFGANFANAVGAIETGTAQNIAAQGIAAGNLQGQLFGDAAFFGAQGVLGAGSAQAQGLLGSQQAIAQGIQSSAEAQASGLLGGAQAQAQGTQQLFNTGLTAAAIYFSDERLKKNMEPIGRVEDLMMYEWDWIDPDLAGQEMSTGFNAQEVQDKYPQHIVEIGDFLAIDYATLNAELSNKIEHRLQEVV